MVGIEIVKCGADTRAQTHKSSLEWQAGDKEKAAGKDIAASALITQTCTRSVLLSFDLISCCWSLHLWNGSFSSPPSLGGLVLHLLLLWFTSLETLALPLAQNGYQMHAAGISESCPQRNLSKRMFFHR